MRQGIKAILFLLFFARCGVSLGQDDNVERIYAGPEYVELRRAVIVAKIVKLEDEELRNTLKGAPIRAILIPPQRTVDPKFVIRICFERQTRLEEREISQRDWKSLRSGHMAMLVTTVSELTGAVRDSGNPPLRDELVTKLETQLAALPQEISKGAKIYVGAKVSELDPEFYAVRPALAEHVRTYRTEVMDTLTNEWAATVIKLPLQEPFVLGKDPVKYEWVFDTVKPSHVNQFKVEGETFKSAWIGGKLVLVRQPTDSTTRPFDPTGLGIAAFKKDDPADIANAMKLLANHEIKSID